MYADDDGDGYGARCERELDTGGAGATGGAGDQHGLPRLKLGTIVEAEPGGAVVDRARRGLRFGPV